MKSRILLLPVLALAGVGASYALADNGGHHAKFQKFQGTTTGASCQRTHVNGTASAPQTFVVTVTKAGKGGSVSPNQVVTVSVGQTGQTVRVNVEGCLTGASSLAARAGGAARVLDRPHDNDGDDRDNGNDDHRRPSR